MSSRGSLLRHTYNDSIQPSASPSLRWTDPASLLLSLYDKEVSLVIRNMEIPLRLCLKCMYAAVLHALADSNSHCLVLPSMQYCNFEISSWIPESRIFLMSSAEGEEFPPRTACSTSQTQYCDFPRCFHLRLSLFQTLRPLQKRLSHSDNDQSPWRPNQDCKRSFARIKR